MSGGIQHRMRQREQVMHAPLYGVLLSPTVPRLLFVTGLAVCLLFFSGAA
jgi:hypothetical protein